MLVIRTQDWHLYEVNSFPLATGTLAALACHFTPTERSLSSSSLCHMKSSFMDAGAWKLFPSGLSEPAFLFGLVH